MLRNTTTYDYIYIFSDILVWTILKVYFNNFCWLFCNFIECNCIVYDKIVFLKCVMWWFVIHMNYKIIPSIKLVNTFITSNGYVCVCVCACALRRLKIHFQQISSGQYSMINYSHHVYISFSSYNWKCVNLTKVSAFPPLPGNGHSTL